jgi:hypothetical protein
VGENQQQQPEMCFNFLLMSLLILTVAIKMNENLLSAVFAGRINSGWIHVSELSPMDFQEKAKSILRHCQGLDIA